MTRGTHLTAVYPAFLMKQQLPFGFIVAELVGPRELCITVFAQRNACCVAVFFFGLSINTNTVIISCESRSRVEDCDVG